MLSTFDGSSHAVSSTSCLSGSLVIDFQTWFQDMWRNIGHQTDIILRILKLQCTAMQWPTIVKQSAFRDDFKILEVKKDWSLICYSLCPTCFVFFPLSLSLYLSPASVFAHPVLSLYLSLVFVFDGSNKSHLLGSSSTLRTSKRPAPLVFIVLLASLLNYHWSMMFYSDVRCHASKNS